VLGLCFYAVVFWLAFVRWLAALPLLCHFCSCSFTLLPQALHLLERSEVYYFLPCCRRLYTCLNVVRCTIFYLAAAGFAIDRLEGDGIKKIRACTPLLRSVGCLWARLQQKK